MISDPAFPGGQADIIVLMAGTADIQSLYPAVSANTMANQLNALVDKILNKFPNAKLVVASIPPVNTTLRGESQAISDGKDAVAKAYSAQVKSIATGKGNRVRHAEINLQNWDSTTIWLRVMDYIPMTMATING